MNYWTIFFLDGVIIYTSYVFQPYGVSFSVEELIPKRCVIA